MNVVNVYNEFKRLSFPNGYWICHTTDSSLASRSFSAVVIPPFTAPSNFGIFLGDERVQHVESPPLPTLDQVLMRVGLIGDSRYSVSFDVKVPPVCKWLEITCRDLDTGRRIGSPYYLTPPELQFDRISGYANMQRSGRTDDKNAFVFAGYDDCMKLTAIINQRLQRSSGIKVLDWGVGSGRISNHMRRIASMEVFGTDIDPVNMGNLHASGYPKTHFRLTAPGAEIPFDDESLDACFGISVFTHLTSPLQFKYLKEIKRILKPGGIGIFSVHGPIHFFTRINDGDMFYRWLDTGLLVTGDNHDISENFSQANDDKLYVDTLHTPGYIFDQWSKFFTGISIIDAPNAYGHDLVVCRK
jgi:ubiquinone/menaquinone biosynthesis C-methylase UbiE